MFEVVKTETGMEEVYHPSCWNCRNSEIDDHVVDSVFQLNCNKCFRNRMDKLRLDWMEARKRTLAYCTFCLDAYKFKRKCETHKCSKGGIYQCAKCSYQLESVKSLEIHVTVTHGKECAICCKMVLCLGKHLRAHVGEKRFSCSVCKKAFFDKGALNKHMAIHKGEKPFDCKVCRKAFTQAGHLKTHMKIHTGERPFTCNLCQRAFSLAGNLKAHVKTHTGERPFNCDVCGTTFTRSDYYKLHMKTHMTGIKPFNCKVCKKGFTRASRLKCHVKTHIADEESSINSIEPRVSMEMTDTAITNETE